MLHDVVVKIVLGVIVKVDHFDNIRVVELGHELGFELKAARQFPTFHQFRGKRFESEDERMHAGAAHPIHHSHATKTDLLKDLVSVRNELSLFVSHIFLGYVCTSV